MKVSQSVPSVWPGYVAAIASLVLSLLLLLAILVFAMTQVGNMVSKYMQEILRATLLSEHSKHGSGSKPRQNLQIERGADHEETQSKEAVVPGTPMRQLRLIFSAELADIPSSQQSEVANAIKEIQAQASQETKWHIWASVLADDAVMERTTYRLLLIVRQNLLALGIAEKQIELQIKKVTKPPLFYEKGEVIIHVTPLQLRDIERGQP